VTGSVTSGGANVGAGGRERETPQDLLAAAGATAGEEFGAVKAAEIGEDTEAEGGLSGEKAFTEREASGHVRARLDG
jgi:hypothetical protein